MNSFAASQAIRRDGSLSPRAFALASFLEQRLYVSWRDHKLDYAWAKRETFCKAVGGVDPTTVKRLIHALVKAGHIKYEPGSGKGNASLFRFTPCAQQSSDPEAAAPPPPGGSRGKGGIKRGHQKGASAKGDIKRGHSGKRGAKGGIFVQQKGAKMPPQTLKRL